MTDERSWKVDLDGVEHQAGQASQLLRQLLHASVDLLNLARRADSNLIELRKVTNDARGRGPVSDDGFTGRPVVLSDLLPSSTAEQEQMAYDAELLLELFSFERADGRVVNSAVMLHYWLNAVLNPPGGGRKFTPMSEPGVRVSGAVFAPLNGDDPKENGDALTLRVQREQGALPAYMNLGRLIVLALVGARVVNLKLSASPVAEDDEDF